jgi:hypothetical protein
MPAFAALGPRSLEVSGFHPEPEAVFKPDGETFPKKFSGIMALCDLYHSGRGP